jgi:hypothetical protein
LITAPDPNKAMINVTMDSSYAHKKTLKEEIPKMFMKKVLDVVNQNVKNALKKFQDTKNKEHEKIQKQINKLREDFIKYQSETKDTIKKEIYEL